MRIGLQHVFPVVALTVLAGGSFWLERTTRSPDEALALAAQHGPDVVVEQMAVTRFNINGLPYYYLDARQMTHQPGEANSRLESPVVHMLRDDVDLRLAADTALARDDGERVDLAGNVRGVRTLPGEPATHFASRSLVVWPNIESAKSSDPVTITQDGTTAQGDGMSADNAFGLITLTGRVHVHLPPQRK